MLKRSGPLKRGTNQLKRTPLARGTSKLARTKLKAKRPGKPRRSSRVRDKAHLAFVRSLPCCAPGCGRQAPSEAHHDTQMRGMGQKSSDDRAVPLCRKDHDGAQHYRGVFMGWGKERMRAWMEEKIAEVMARKPQAPTHIELRFASGRRTRVAVADCTVDAADALVLPVLGPEFEAEDVVEAVGIVEHAGLAAGGKAT